MYCIASCIASNLYIWSGWYVIQSTYCDVQRPKVPMFKDQWSMSKGPILTTFKNGNIGRNGNTSNLIGNNEDKRWNHDIMHFVEEMKC